MELSGLFPVHHADMGEDIRFTPEQHRTINKQPKNSE